MRKIDIPLTLHKIKNLPEEVSFLQVKQWVETMPCQKQFSGFKLSRWLAQKLAFFSKN